MGSSPRKRRDVVLTALEDAVHWIWDALLTALLWLALVRPGWKSIRQRYKNYEVGARRCFEPEHAKVLIERSDAASEHTDAKVRQLLTLSAALTPIALVLAAQSRPRVLGLVIVVALVVAVLLCLAVIEVRVTMEPTLEQKRENGTHFDEWAWDLFRSAQQNQAVHRLRVDVYTAARRYFIVAFLLAPMAAATTVGSRSHPGAAEVRMPTGAKDATAAVVAGNSVTAVPVSPPLPRPADTSARLDSASVSR